jgi:MFS family permease
LIGQVLFLSVTLATTFYSIHAASLHGEKSGSISVFVVASSLGGVVGAPLWSWLLDKGVRLVFILGGLSTMSAAILALIIEYVNGLQFVLLHAPVFLLATLGYQAVTQGRHVYVVNMTTDEERPFLISISQTLLAALSIGVAVLFGVLAQVNGEVWPLVAILAMNTVAVLYQVIEKHYFPAVR